MVICFHIQLNYICRGSSPLTQKIGTPFSKYSPQQRPPGTIASFATPESMLRWGLRCPPQRSPGVMWGMLRFAIQLFTMVVGWPVVTLLQIYKDGPHQFNKVNMSPRGSMALLVHSHLCELEERSLQLIWMPLETLALGWKHIQYIIVLSVFHNWEDMISQIKNINTLKLNPKSEMGWMSKQVTQRILMLQVRKTHRPHPGPLEVQAQFVKDPNCARSRFHWHLIPGHPR